MMMSNSVNKRYCLLTCIFLATSFYGTDGFLQPFLGRIIPGLRRTIYYQQLDISTANDDTNCDPKSELPCSLKHPFNSWPNEVIESDGDYTKETYLEEIIGGNLYMNNNDNILPRLPVPTLNQTIDRFIPTALPLCESDEEHKSLMQACAKFEDQAKDLQLRLLQRDEEWKYSSWLQQWWNQKGYLEVRDPIAVQVSYFLSIDDDPSLPTQKELNLNNEEYFGATNPCILRGAVALASAAMIRKRVCSGKLPCDKAGPKSLCSTGYKYLFNTCRIPRLKSDIVRMYDPSAFNHCIVACKGYFFSVRFVDYNANPLPLEVLTRALIQCQNIAKQQEALDLPKIGWLSGCNRDDWAIALNKLSLYESFREAMKELESGAFVLCLDETIPDTVSDASESFWIGRDLIDCNRFYDKSINIIVNGLGQAALLGEHSMMDGSIPMEICNQIHKYKYSRLIRASFKSLASLDKNNGGKEIDVHDIFANCWEDAELAAVAHQLGGDGRKQYQKLIDSVELKTIDHKDYGKQFIKKRGISPDAYMQLVLQLAAYRCFGKQIATYEAAQTRQFVHGRTETVRTVSMESKAFVEAMGPKSKTDHESIGAKKEKLRLLREAAESHHDYIQSACDGLGVDRHFLGLSLLLREDEEPPDLFKDPVFIRSKTWRLSTSGLPHCPGFGPVVKDGIGVGYSLHSNTCMLHISSRRENSCVDKFCGEVILALDDMKWLLGTDEA